MKRLSATTLPAWLAEKNATTSAVISTRVRLARNFTDTRFPLMATGSELERNLERIEEFAAAYPQWRLEFTRVRDLDETHRGALAERGLIHADSAAAPAHVGLAVGEGERVSLVVNEEDHVRIQVLDSGLNLEAGLKTARELEAKLSESMGFAVHKQFGYLTACPTNVGTGLRASILMHLPALALTRGIVQVLQAVLHVGLSVRGFYGEGNDLRSVFFQISNQVTLGRTEEEIGNHLAGVTRQITEREEEARKKLLQDQRLLLEDKVGRAVGVLSGCRVLGLEEALDMLSTVRLGMETGILEPVDRSVLNELLLLLQPAHLQLAEKRNLSATEQTIKRAELMKRQLRLK